MILLFGQEILAQDWSLDGKASAAEMGPYPIAILVEWLPNIAYSQMIKAPISKYEVRIVEPIVRQGLTEAQVSTLPCSSTKQDLEIDHCTVGKIE